MLTEKAQKERWSFHGALVWGYQLSRFRGPWSSCPGCVLVQELGTVVVTVFDLCSGGTKLYVQGKSVWGQPERGVRQELTSVGQACIPLCPGVQAGF